MSMYGKNIDFYRDYLIVNEAYVGKTPNLLEIEKKIGEVRNKIKFYGANNTLKEILEINRLVEKQFGMDIFALQIYPSKFVNGYTHVLGTNFDIADNEVLHNMITGSIKDGYKFKPNNNFCILVNLSSSIFTDNTFTNEEIVAIMLHEIGHNFADCIYDDIELSNREMMQYMKKLLEANVIFDALLILPTLGIMIPAFLSNLSALYGKTYNNEKKNAEQRRIQTNGQSKISGAMLGLKGKVSDVHDFVSGVIARLGSGNATRRRMRQADINGVPEKMRKSLGRQNELIADKFAGIYGYGPAQVSALLKMDSQKSDAYHFINKIGKGKCNDRFDEAMRRINDYDVHPHSIQRANSEISLLKKELEKEDLDPRVRKLIQDQLNEITDLINKYSTVSTEFSNNEEAQALYNAYIRDECPDAVDKEIEDKINQAFEDALNNKKRKKKNK